MNLAKLKIRLRKREEQRDRQHRLWKRTHERGHAKAARRDSRAVKRLRGLIKKERERRHRAPKRMFDDVTLSLVPEKAEAVGCYVNGAFKNCAEAKTKFPHAHRLSISVTASDPNARCLDIEGGDATIDEAPGWFHDHAKERPHEVPVFYISVSMADELVAYLKAHGIKRRQYDLFTAHYTFEPHLCGPKTCGECRAHADSTQYSDVALGRSLDVSKLSPDFFA
jgi:hypothetical protein